MTSNRPKHTQAMPQPPLRSEASKAPCSSESQRDQSASAVMKKTTLSIATESLIEQIVDTRNIERAWRKVRANRGAPGPDGITLDDFPAIFRSQWPAVRQQLLDGIYQPSPARRKSIPKPDGSERHLGIPNVQDRLIQQAVLQVLTPIFDPSFSDSSFGFRPKRSAHGAVKQVQAHIRSGYRQAVDMDLSKFFDRVQHDVLLVRMARKVTDKRVLGLIGRYLRAGVMVDSQLQPSIEGTMQGGPLSPLLANILLDDFDKELEKRGLRFVRYADDFLVFTKTVKAAHRVYRSVERYLTRKLKLVINHQKSSTRPTDGIEFLGYRFEGFGGHFRVGPKNIEKFKSRVKEITCRKRGVSMETRFQELRSYLRGWAGYFALVPIKSFFRELDKWIRRRIRSCYWKQWRKPKTRVAKLLKLGLPRNEAVPFGSCSRGPWHMSRCSSLQRTLNGDMLAAVGLVCLSDLWSKLAPKFRTA